MADLKRLRELLNYSQSQLANELGVSDRTVQNWESGKVIPKTKLPMLMNLAKRFPNESFVFIDAKSSPGSGLGNQVKGISSHDLKIFLDEMSAQRQDFIKELNKRDSQIDSLIKILKSK